MTVKVGILGAGFIGRIHAVLLKRDPRVELVAIADSNHSTAERLAHEVGSKAVADLDGIIKAGATAVFICTPNVLHVEPVTQALAAGLHVFSEKPMATTLEGATRRTRPRASIRSASTAVSRMCTRSPKSASTTAASCRVWHR